MYGHTNPDDPSCSQSRTGFIITFADFPVLCISKFQTETAFYKMEAETICLAHCCRELFPIINMTQSQLVLGIPKISQLGPIYTLPLKQYVLREGR